MDGEGERKAELGVGDVRKSVMEDQAVETKDGLMNNTAEYIESSRAICFFLPTKVPQKATPY